MLVACTLWASTYPADLSRMGIQKRDGGYAQAFVRYRKLRVYLRPVLDAVRRDLAEVPRPFRMTSWHLSGRLVSAPNTSSAAQAELLPLWRVSLALSPANLTV